MTVPFMPTAETIRSSRTQVARDIVKSRARIAELSAMLRAETAQLTSLLLIGEIVGVTDVGAESSGAVVDASVQPENAEPRQVAA